MAKKISVSLIIGGKISKSLQKAFKMTEDQSAQLDKAFSATSKVGTAAFKAVAASVGTIGTAILTASESTRDFRKDLAKMYNNAELAGISQKEAWGGLEDLYSMSGEFDSANEAMSNLLATGYKGKDLTKIIEAVNGATVKWQDTISQEGMADAINETVMSGKSIGQFDEILSRSGVNIDTFNDGLLACNGLAERQQYVLDWLAKSGLTEVNSAYQEQNKNLVDAYKADLKYQNSMAELGAASESVAAALKSLGAEGISYVAEKIKGIDLATVTSALQKAGELGKQAFDAIWNALSKIDWESLINAAVSILTVFTNIFNFVVNNWSMISPVIYGIVAAMVAYKAITIAGNTVTAISNGLKIAGAAASAFFTGSTLKEAAAKAVATAAQLGLNAAFLACPITWIVLGIAAIVAIFVTLWKKCEGFRNFWKSVWKAITEAFDVAVEGIKEGIKWVEDAIKGLIDWFENIGDWFSNLFGGGKKSINVQVNGEKAKAAKNSLGGTYSSPLMTWVAEGGDTETIVPHNNSPRSQALALEAVKGTGVSVGGNTYVFSPNITVSGGNESQIRGLLEDEFAKFKAQMEEWASNQRRLSY